MPPLRSYKNMSVKAGVLRGATYPEDGYKNHVTGEYVFDARAGRSVASIAAALEFGDRQRIARPFMHVTSAQYRAEWARSLRALLKEGVSTRGAFTAVGQIMKEDIQHTISTWPADNSDAWAAVKGFNHGLILSSHLLKSIEYETSEGAGDGT